MRFFSTILSLLFLGASFASAASPGTSGADVLKNPTGVRPAALGGTYSSFGDDVYVIGFNPAGLARVAKYSLGLDHAQGFADVQTESFSLGIPTRRYGTLGLQFLMRHLSDINNELATDPPVKAADYLLTLANARQFGKLSLGGSFKTIISRLGEKQSFTNAFDFGIQVQWSGFNFAGVVQNIGPAARFEPNPQEKDPLPMTFRLGMARPILASPQATLLGGVEGVKIRDEAWQGSVGMEYWHRTLIALRAGYRRVGGDSLAGGFSAGAGLRNSLGRLEYEVGYAWRPSRVQEGFTLNSHLFGLLVWY